MTGEEPYSTNRSRQSEAAINAGKQTVQRWEKRRSIRGK